MGTAQGVIRRIRLRLWTAVAGIVRIARRKKVRGCYDATIHQCDCDAGRCTQELCAADGGIWTDGCPDHCDEATCETESTGGEEPDGDGDTTGNADPAGSPAGISPSRMLRETKVGGWLFA